MRFWPFFYVISRRDLALIKEFIVASKDEILASLAAANASLDGIQADITALKALIDSGAGLAEIQTAVDALAAKASGIDSQTSL